jgi:Zn-dependent metalloprotease
MEIERINLTSVLTPSPSRSGQLEIDDDLLVAELEAAFERLRPLTLRNRPIDFAIRVATVGPVSSPGELFVRLRELIDGLPVAPEGVITIDASTGALRSFGMGFTADAAMLPDRSSWLSEEQAVAVAQRAVVSAHGGPFPQVAETELRLVRKSELVLQPEWVVRFEFPARYEAVVDALTGDARTYSTVVH